MMHMESFDEYAVVLQTPPTGFPWILLALEVVAALLYAASVAFFVAALRAA